LWWLSKLSKKRERVVKKNSKRKAKVEHK